jgi:hypothetical protein
LQLLLKKSILFFRLFPSFGFSSLLGQYFLLPFLFLNELKFSQMQLLLGCLILLDEFLLPREEGLLLLVQLEMVLCLLLAAARHQLDALLHESEAVPFLGQFEEQGVVVFVPAQVAAQARQQLLHAVALVRDRAQPVPRQEHPLALVLPAHWGLLLYLFDGLALYVRLGLVLFVLLDQAHLLLEVLQELEVALLVAVDVLPL